MPTPASARLHAPIRSAEPLLAAVVAAVLASVPAGLMVGATPAAAQPADGPADRALAEGPGTAAGKSPGDGQAAATGGAADVPVISSDDPGTGYAVMEGPSEPAGDFDPLDPSALPAPAAAAPTPQAADQAPSSSAAPPSGPLPSAPPASAQPPFAQPPSAPIAAAPMANDFVQRAAPPQEMRASPVVVELFTSQGCSSCPPADALLAELAARPDVLTLTWHVDYWDYLGWPDGFAHPEFTARQRAYGRITGERALFTPQIVVGGIDTLLDLGPANLDALIDAHEAEAGPIAMHATRHGAQVAIELTPGPTPAGAAAVDLVRYLPSREVAIGGGENLGRVVSYRNVVVSVERLATWDGRAPLRMTITPGAGTPQALPDDTRHAVLVQQLTRGRSLGPVLAAVPID